MRYAESKRKGFMIGSGVAEAACKTLVAQRLKLSGMRRGTHGAQAILTMRGWDQSERFDEAWSLVAATYHCEVHVLANVVDITPESPRKQRRPPPRCELHPAVRPARLPFGRVVSSGIAPNCRSFALAAAPGEAQSVGVVTFAKEWHCISARVHGPENREVEDDETNRMFRDRVVVVIGRGLHIRRWVGPGQWLGGTSFAGKRGHGWYPVGKRRHDRVGGWWICRWHQWIAGYGRFVGRHGFRNRWSIGRHRRRCRRHRRCGPDRWRGRLGDGRRAGSLRAADSHH